MLYIHAPLSPHIRDSVALKASLRRTDFESMWPQSSLIQSSLAAFAPCSAAYCLLAHLKRSLKYPHCAPKGTRTSASATMSGMRPSISTGVSYDDLGRQISIAKQPLLERAFSDRSRTPTDKIPKDPYGFVTFTIFLFGVASLLPWNFFITATDYWNYKFRDPAVRVNSTETTPLQKSFNSYLAIASKLPYILFLVVNTAISNKVRCSVRVGFSLLACTALFLATTILVKVNTDKYQKEFLAATLCIVVLINVVCGFLQGGGTGLAGVLPSRYMAANVMGQATGGIFATLAQLFSLLLDAHPTDAALLYFGIATGLLIMTQMFFGILVKMNFYKYYMGHQNPCKISAETGAQNTSRKTPFWVIFKSFVNRCLRTSGDVVPKFSSFYEVRRQRFIMALFTRVCKKGLVKPLTFAGWKFHIAIVAIFWVTLAVFPAITALVRSSHADSGSALTNKFFVPLTCFVIFNFTDLFGRILAKYQPIPSSRGTVVLSVAIARIVFIPLLLLCNVTPASRSVTSVMFPHDWQFILIMTLFGLSNGYVTTLALTYASKACSEAHQEVAGSLAAVFLGVGLALGSLSSYGCIQLL